MRPDQLNWVIKKKSKTVLGSFLFEVMHLGECTFEVKKKEMRIWDTITVQITAPEIWIHPKPGLFNVWFSGHGHC